MFMAKWGGIVISAVFILLFSSFGGFYIYSVNRVDNTLAWVTQSINISRVSSATVDASTEMAYFTVTLVVNNTTDTDANVTISDLSLTVNGLDLEATPANEWQVKVKANDKAYIEGQIMMTYRDFLDVRSKGATPISINGDLYAKSRYGIVMRDASRPIAINSRLQIY